MRIKQVIPTSNSISEAWCPLDLGSLPLSHPGHDIFSLLSYECPLPLLLPTLFLSSPWPTLTSPPAPSSMLKGWKHQAPSKCSGGESTRPIWEKRLAQLEGQPSHWTLDCTLHPLLQAGIISSSTSFLVLKKPCRN